MQSEKVHAILKEKTEQENASTLNGKNVVGEFQDLSLKNAVQRASKIVYHVSDKADERDRSETPSPETKRAVEDY
jgi:hypothetical protein